jgi:hypothetical protein
MSEQSFCSALSWCAVAAFFVHAAWHISRGIIDRRKDIAERQRGFDVLPSKTAADADDEKPAG